MKKLLVFLIVLTLGFGSILNAESDEWGAWFKAGMENGKHNEYEPEDKQENMKEWRNNKDELIQNYKKYLQRDDNSKAGECEECSDIDRRANIINSYYYDKTDSEINKIVDFFIYAINNEKNEKIKLKILLKLTELALKKNGKAFAYINNQKNNTSLSRRLQIEFKISAMNIYNDSESFNYLMDLIKQAQEVETTDVKYNSSEERIITWRLNRNFFAQRYLNGLDYNYGLPLVRQLILSRDKIVQTFAGITYYQLTNKSEMKRIYKDCWAKVHNENTSRKEFLNALYGLQALYALSKRNFSKHKIGFKEIDDYFARFGGMSLIDNNWRWIANSKIKKLTAKEKKYFQDRLRSK